ncbi:hypothetical protein IJU97_04515 [bacterium]|nr:hypothetical protein [bacterium]
MLLAKLILVGSTYSFAFSQLSFYQTLYYFFSLFQEDLLIFGLSLVFVFIISKIKSWWIKWIFFVLIAALFALYLADMLVILFFQQRLLISS